MIESVFIPDTPAMTFCISTQVGCAMACRFCLTGKMGLVRNLTAGEIVGQVRVLADALGMREKRFNLVLMGMGEPLHNYDETMKALRILADEHGLAVSPRRVTLSTVGLLSALERLAREPLMPNLAISLHAPTDAIRGDLVPINKKYGVADIIDACRRFPLKRRSRITFEYVLLAGVNDSPDDARRLARLLSGVKSKVNLIPLNAAPGIPFERPSDAGDRPVRADPRRSPSHRVGQEEPRARHQGGVRTVDRRGTAPVPGAAARHARIRSLVTKIRSRSAEAVPGGLRRRFVTDGLTAHRLACGGDLHADPFVADVAGRDSHLQVVAGHGERAVLERQRPMDRAELRFPEPHDEPTAYLAHARRPFPDDRAVDLPPIADATVPGRSEYGKTCTCVSGDCSRYPHSSSKSSSVSPGNPTITSEPIEADGMRARIEPTRPRVVSAGVRTTHGGQHRSLACCSGRWKCGAKQSWRATRSTISCEQSIGSSELIRKRTIRFGMRFERAARSSISDDAADADPDRTIRGARRSARSP